MRQVRTMFLLLLMLGMGAAAYAQPFGGGTGASNDPYRIGSVAHLKELRAKVAEGEQYSGKHFFQTADLDLAGERWIPIGSQEKPFEGLYNGGMRTISGLLLDLNAPQLKSLKFVGLFGAVKVIQHVHLQSPIARGSSQALQGFGFVAGFAEEAIACVVEGGAADITVLASEGEIFLTSLVGMSNSPVTLSYTSAKVNATFKVKQLTGDVLAGVAALPAASNSSAAGEVSVTLARDGNERLAFDFALSLFGIAKAEKALLYSKLSLKGQEQFEATFAEGKSFRLDMGAFGPLSDDSYFDNTILGTTIEPVVMGLETGKLQEGKADQLPNIDGSYFMFEEGAYPVLDIVRYRASAVRYVAYWVKPDKEHPYEVATGDDLMFAKRKNFPTYLRQVADITLPALQGPLVEMFAGTYDGNGYAIKGSSMELAPDAQALGLFGALDGDARVLNLTLDGFALNGVKNDSQLVAGVLAGNAIGGTIANVRIKNASISLRGNGQTVYAGGLVGTTTDNVKLNYVVVEGFKLEVKDAEHLGVGGLIGYHHEGGLSLLGCEVRGLDLSIPQVSAPSYVGGLVGYLLPASPSNAFVYQCISEGKIVSAEQSGDYVIAGGLVGYASLTHIEQCAARTGVSIAGKATAVGGMVGALTMAEENSIVDSYVYLPDGLAISCAGGNTAGFIGRLAQNGTAASDTRRIANCWVSAAVNKTSNTAKPFAVYDDHAACAQYVQNCRFDSERDKLGLDDENNQNATASNFVDFGSTYAGYQFKEPRVWYRVDKDTKYASLFWEKSSAWHPLRGDGSKDAPYEIATADNLHWLMYQDHLFDQQLHFKQTADIDAAASMEWSEQDEKVLVGKKEYFKGFRPIAGAPSSPAWNCSYDGGGYAIKNLWVVRPNEPNVGMFGWVASSYEGYIKDLQLEGVTIMGSDQVGGLVGYVDASNYAISNCRVSIDSVVATTSQVGGLVGCVDQLGKLDKCMVTPKGEHALVAISEEQAGANQCIGGLVGILGDSQTKVEGCVSLVGVSVPKGTLRVGGFVGQSNADIRDCYTRCTITLAGAAEASTGGFVGSLQDKGVETSYAVVPIVNMADKENPAYVTTKAFVGEMGGGKLSRTYFQSSIADKEQTNAAETDNAKCAGYTEVRFKNGVTPDGFGAQWSSIAGQYPRLFDTEGQRVRYNQPLNGAISVTVDGKTVVNDAFVLVGVELNITLTPDEGYEVDKLMANGVEVTVSNNVAKYVVPTSTVHLVATFKKRSVNPQPVVPVVSIALAPNTLKIKVGESAPLQVTFNPQNASNKNVTWSSNDGGIATVANGTVTGVAIGKTVIKAVSQDGNHTAECAVEVEAGNQSSVESLLLASTSVMPNPFADRLEVRHAAGVEQYQLLNAAGIVVVSGRASQQEDLVIETANLPTGLYLLRLVAADGDRVQRVLKR